MNADRVMVWVLILFSTVGIVRCANVADGDCSSENQANCTDVLNAECVGDTPTCQCNQGYEDESDPTICTAIGLDGTCAADGDCTLVNNAVCTFTTCQCANGYIKNRNACDKVFGSTCSGTAACAGLVNSVCSNGACGCTAGFTVKDNICVKVFGSACTGVVECTGLANSVCSGDTCGCAAGFVEKNNLCVQAVSGTDCTEAGTECESITNAECVDKKCHCKDGFVENADTCDEKSGAVSVKSVVALVFGCLIMLLVQAL